MTIRPSLADIKALIAKAMDIDPSTIHDNADLIDGLGMESLEVIELAMALEEKYGRHIEDDEIPRMTTPAEILRLLTETPTGQRSAA